MKLGKLPVKHDPQGRTLRLERYLDLARRPPLPADHRWSAALTRPLGMLANDVVGDCTVATFGHAAQVWSANNRREWRPSDADVLAAYSAVSGYDPSQPQSDAGAALLDVLKYMRKVGLAGHRIGAFAQVDPQHQAMVTAAIYLFGGVAVGLNLPRTAQAQVGTLWDVPWYGARWSGAPGSWGGHAVFGPDYARQPGPGFATWGEWQLATWRFVRKYCDECYAILAPDWVRPGRLAPSGFNLTALQADLAAVTG